MDELTSDLDHVQTIIHAICAARDAACDVIDADTKAERRQTRNALDQSLIELRQLIGSQGRLVVIARKVGHEQPESWGLPFIRAATIQPLTESANPMQKGQEHPTSASDLVGRLDARRKELKHWLPILTTARATTDTYSSKKKKQKEPDERRVKLRNLYAHIMKIHSKQQACRKAVVAEVKGNEHLVKLCEELGKKIDLNLVKAAVEHTNSNGK